MTDEKKLTKLDIEYDYELTELNTFHALITHLQQLRDDCNKTRYDIINQTIEFNYDHTEEQIYLSIYTKRLETEYERQIKNETEYQNQIRHREEELDRLQSLIEKYPKEVLNWMTKKSEK